jgi:hypothetical protein
MIDYTEFLNASVSLALTALLSLLTWGIRSVIKYISSRNALVNQMVTSQKSALIRAEVLDIAETAVRYTEQVFAEQIKKAREDGRLTTEEAKEAVGIALTAGFSMAKERGLSVGSDTLRYAIEASLQKLKVEKKMVIGQPQPLALSEK